MTTSARVTDGDCDGDDLVNNNEVDPSCLIDQSAQWVRGATIVGTFAEILRRTYPLRAGDRHQTRERNETDPWRHVQNARNA